MDFEFEIPAGWSLAVECVLGVSLTPTTVRMVLVEGAAADGATVDHDSVDIAVVDGPDELISAIVGTRESSVASGHRLHPQPPWPQESLTLT